MSRSRSLIIASLLFLSLPLAASAQALTTVEWDRNADDLLLPLVRHYELYICTTPNSATQGCDPLAGGVRWGVDVLQPPVNVALPAGVLQSVAMPIPTTHPAGRVSVIAVDVLGNRSLQSNIVAFRLQPLAAPKGLRLR